MLFTKGCAEEDDTGSYLAGNLQMYSLESLEPNQPMYLSLRKVTRSQINVDETFHVYPNPFENALNISFNLPVVSEVKVAVYTTGGQRLYLESLGVLGEGQQDITLSLRKTPFDDKNTTMENNFELTTPCD